MRVSDTDLRLLRVFDAVAKNGGFSTAQSVLNVSQSTISNQIAALESRLGCRLCERGRRGFKLTDQGAVLARSVEKLFLALSDFEASASHLRNDKMGELRLGVVDGTVSDAQSPLVPILAEFARLGEQVKLSLINGDPLDLEQRLLDGRIDAAIGSFNEHPMLESYYLYEERNGLYCSKDHPLRFRTDVTLIDVNEYPIIRRTYRNLHDMEMFGDLSPNATVNSMEATVTLILTGAYIGFLPVHFARPWVDACDMHRITGPGASVDVEINITVRRNGKRARLLDEFIRIARINTVKIPIKRIS